MIALFPEKGARRDLYEVCNRKIEKWSEFTRNIHIKGILLGYYIAPYIISYFNYFILRKAEASFYMTIPATYVFIQLKRSKQSPTTPIHTYAYNYLLLDNTLQITIQVESTNAIHHSCHTPTSKWYASILHIRYYDFGVCCIVCSAGGVRVRPRGRAAGFRD